MSEKKMNEYRKVSNIRRTLLASWIFDHSEVVGASLVGSAPTTSSFSTEHLASIYCAKKTVSWVKKHLGFGFGAAYTRDFSEIKPRRNYGWYYSSIFDLMSNGQPPHPSFRHSSNSDHA